MSCYLGFVSSATKYWNDIDKQLRSSAILVPRYSEELYNMMVGQ